MTEEDIKEQLSRHFVCSLAHVHGVKCTTPDKDHGVDVLFTTVNKIIKEGKPTRYLDSGNHLPIQIKSTTSSSSRLSRTISGITFGLESKTYNDLIYRRTDPLPLYLVLVILNEESSEYIEVRNNELALMGEAYWYLPHTTDVETNNTSSINITIPLANKLDFDFVRTAYSQAGVSI